MVKSGIVSKQKSEDEKKMERGNADLHKYFGKDIKFDDLLPKVEEKWEEAAEVVDSE